MSRLDSLKTNDISIELMRATNGKARGSFHSSDAKTRQKFRMVEAGCLQTSGKWASFTARLRTNQTTEEFTAR